MMNKLDSDSDYESYTESSDSEDQDDPESAFWSHAQSILSNLDASIEKIDDFLAFDRGFVHGDIVSSVTDPSGQMGRVVDMDMLVDLKSSSGDIIKYVNSKRILRVRSFVPGDYVVHGPYLGRVDRAFDLVTVLFDDGAKCEISTCDPENLVPISPTLLEDSPYPYYPGQRVQIRHSTIFKSARWLCGTWKGRRDEGTVCHAEIGSVHVSWIASFMVGCDMHSSFPPCIQDPKGLTLLSCFPHANWQLGDWCKLPRDYFQGCQLTAKGQISPSMAPQYLTKMQNLGRKDHACEQVYEIVKTKMKVDVLWQDRNFSVGVDSQNLFPVNNVGDHDFWPNQFVLEKATSEDARGSSDQRVGVVKNVDSQQRTVKVRWVLELDHVNDSNGQVDEIVSAYELIEHPDYTYSLGDVVFKSSLQSEDLRGTPPAVQTDGQSQEHEDSSIRVEGKVILNKNLSFRFHDDYASRYLSCIGNVIGLKDGSVMVRWATGHISEVKPSEILGIDRFDGPAEPVSNDEVINEHASEEMSEQDKLAWHGKEEDVQVLTVNGSGEDFKKDLWHPSGFLFPQAAVGLLRNVAASLFGYRRSTSLSGTINSGYSDDLDNSWNLHPKAPASETTNGFDQCNEKSENPIIKTENEQFDAGDLRQTSLMTQGGFDVNKPETVSVGCEKMADFKQFDTVGDYSDNHFVNGNSKGRSQVTKGWLRKVQQEWSILKKDLPDTIYIRVYEERMDLLRASIVGAPGTPYHDNLFFFDICFPPDYPHEPPLVHYNSGGLRLNPNLYESGKVCLSLLKTWTGTGTEVWNPESSTILQVLLSLQALVLNEKPYFNEAGYDKQIGRAEGERNSITYNENAFLLSCRSMLFLLRNPPKKFEQLVVDHFTRRSHHILLACKAYMDGAPVGCAFEGGVVTAEGHNSSSTGFKIMLRKLFPKLVLGFNEIGIDRSQFLDHASRANEAGEEQSSI